MSEKFSWLQAWLVRLAEKYLGLKVSADQVALDFSWLRVSPSRSVIVIDEISYGSEPKGSFYALVVTSTLIASFGLMANSTAVIIGAMLVAPLMTPILGIALALVRGDPGLLGRAIRAEIIGIVLAVVMAAIFGLLPLGVIETPEMLARTHPNLLDLLVAILAGFAGSYAMVNERISPALPGVAIAVAIVPPLANTGLCLSKFALLGAYGSFLLFTANFLAILLVSAATFWFAGLAPHIPSEQKRLLMRRLAVAGIGFFVVAIILTFSLVQMARNRYLSQSVEKTLAEEFSELPSTSMVRTIHQKYQGKLYILTTIRTPEVLPPNRVKYIQNILAQRLGRPIRLIVRCISTKDISASGSTSMVTAQNLDGFFLTQKVNPEVMQVQLAEQALREILYTRPDLKLLNVSLLRFPVGPVILVTIQGQRVLIAAEVKNFEEKVRNRLQNPDVRLLVRCLVTIDVDSRGEIIYGWAHFGKLTPEEKTLRDQIEAMVKQEIRKIPDIFAITVDAAKRQDDSWAVSVEAVGARVISVRDVSRLQAAVSRRLQRPIKINIRSKAEAMVTTSGYTSAEEFIRRRLEKKEEANKANQQLAGESASPL